jgi:uncharacterized membrane protein (UPF0136 family)
MTPPGTSAALTPSGYFIGSIFANPGVSFTSGVLRGAVLPPGKFICTTQQNFGVNTPSSNSATLLAYPYNDVGVTV